MENININTKASALGKTGNQDDVDLFLWHLRHGDFFSQGQLGWESLKLWRFGGLNFTPGGSRLPTRNHFCVCTFMKTEEKYYFENDCMGFWITPANAGEGRPSAFAGAWVVERSQKTHPEVRVCWENKSASNWDWWSLNKSVETNNFLFP